jgi:hypothetical protein
LGILNHIVDALHVLADVFIVDMTQILVQKALNFKLMLQFQVKDLCLLTELYLDVNSLAR